MSSLDLETFGRYRIIEVVPGSGPGTVFYASDPDFEGEVAIKIFPRLFFTDPARRFKYEQEQRILALLDSTHITPIIDIGEWEGQMYNVMRWMEGGSLAKRLAHGPLATDVVADLFYKIARILQEAHRVGIVHRDIKPENILFDKDDEVYLSDFGMLKLAESLPQGVGSYLVGALDYVSPEEAFGERDIDERSDIYALGILLYQLLTGQDVSMSSQTSLDVSSIPPVFREVIQRATSSDRELRYRNLEEMVQELYELPDEESFANSQSSATEARVRPQTSGLKYALGTLGIIFLLAFSWVGFSGEWRRIFEILDSNPVLAAWISQSPVRDVVGGNAITPAPPIDMQPPTSTIPVIIPTQIIPTIENNSPALLATEDLLITPETTTSLPTMIPNTPTPFPVTIGGASQLAFLHENDIWLINLNGSGLERLTTDGKEKTQMRWTVDGKYLLYQTEGLYKLFDPGTDTYLELGRVADLDISADLSRIVVGDMVVHDRQIKKWMNAFIDLDLSNVGSVSLRRNMKCNFYAGRLSRFSASGTRMTSLITVSQNGVQYEVIGVYDIGDCEQEPQLAAFFLGNDILIRGYSGTRGTHKMDDYSWDGGTRFVFNSQVISGYGDLYYYDLQTRIYQLLPPLGSCCYRFARWSPDGTYLLFAYIDTKLSNQVKVYYRPWEEVLTNTSAEDMSEEFLSLPAYMFENRSNDFQLALRPGN